MTDKKYLSNDEAAAYTGIGRSTLNKMRMRNDGPVFIRAGKRRVVYAVADLDRYMEANRQKSTHEAAES